MWRKQVACAVFGRKRNVAQAAACARTWPDPGQILVGSAICASKLLAPHPTTPRVSLTSATVLLADAHRSQASASAGRGSGTIPRQSATTFCQSEQSWNQNDDCDASSRPTPRTETDRATRYCDWSRRLPGVLASYEAGC